MLKNNNPVLINDTIADILYNKIQTQYKQFGNPVIHITDFEVFQAALESRNPSNIWFYNSELVAQSLNKIKGVTASYFCEDEEEHDGEITVATMTLATPVKLDVFELGDDLSMALIHQLGININTKVTVDTID